MDPTSEDSWFFVTDEDPRYGDVENIDDRSSAEDDKTNAYAKATRDLITDRGKAMSPASAEETADKKRIEDRGLAKEVLDNENAFTPPGDITLAKKILGDSSLVAWVDTTHDPAHRNNDRQ